MDLLGERMGLEWGFYWYSKWLGTGTAASRLWSVPSRPVAAARALFLAPPVKINSQRVLRILILVLGPSGRLSRSMEPITIDRWQQRGYDAVVVVTTLLLLLLVLVTYRTVLRNS